MYAQESAVKNEPEITWSESQRAGRRERDIKFIGTDSTNFYLLINKPGKGDGQVLEVYNRQTMKRTEERLLQLPDVPNHTMYFDEVMVFSGALLGVALGYDNGADVVRAFAFRILPAGSPGTPIFLGETPARKRKGSPFDYRVSRNDSCLLIHPEHSIERRLNERYSFRVLDANLEVLWQKDLELPYESELLEINQYRIDNRGHLYMMSGVTTPEKGRRAERGKSETSYAVLSYDPYENSVKEFEVALDGKWVIATSFDLTDHNDLVIGGFYSNDRYFSIAGTFFFRINGEKKKIAASGMQAFSSDFLERFMKARKVERGKELENYYFDHFVVRDDGGATFIAEQYYMRQDFRTDITTGRQEIIYYYHYNDLIVVDVSSEGVINWTIRVPKRQMSINDNGTYSSYALSSKGDNLYLVFNDEASNSEALNANPESTPRMMNSARQSSATLVHIDGSGTVSRSNLFKSKTKDTILRPKVHLGMDDGVLYLYGRLRRSYRLARLRF